MLKVILDKNKILNFSEFEVKDNQRILNFILNLFWKTYNDLSEIKNYLNQKDVFEIDLSWFSFENNEDFKELLYQQLIKNFSKSVIIVDIQPIYFKAINFDLKKFSC